MGLKNWLRRKIRNAVGFHEIMAAVGTATLKRPVETRRPGSVLSCRFNGADALAPVEMLRVWPHCLHPGPEELLNYFVERAQSDWLCSRLRPGDTALDVGAAFGAITLALARAVGREGRVHSFEPARTARRLLRKLLELNGLTNVTVASCAVSDSQGAAGFREYTSDNDLSWASDASVLTACQPPAQENYVTYDVEVTTIDVYVARHGLEPRAIKIDIEGAELQALHGAAGTLERLSPNLCVDIQADMRSGESFLDKVETYLSRFEYDQVVEGHVLYAQSQRRDMPLSSRRSHNA